MKNNKKLLILNGSHSELELIKLAKDLGYYVITTGNQDWLLGHKFSDDYVNIDYDNREELLDYCLKNNIFHICASAHDNAAISAAFLKEKLNLKGADSFDLTKKLHYKNEFMKICRDLEIRCPQSQMLKMNEPYNVSHLAFPLIIKPVDGNGGRGISIVNSHSELIRAVAKVRPETKSQEFLVEEYIDGFLCSFSTIVIDGVIKESYLDREVINKETFSVEMSLSLKDHRLTQLMTEVLQKIVGNLNLCHGVFHGQFIVKGSDVYLIEVTRRISGDLYNKPLQWVKGVHWDLAYLEAQLGTLKKINKLESPGGHWGRFCITTDKVGIYEGLSIDPNLEKYIKEVIEIFPQGKTINNNRQRIGIIIFQFESEDPEQFYEHFKSNVKVQLKNE